MHATCNPSPTVTNGRAAAVITNPLDVAKTQLQVQGELQARGQVAARPKGMAGALVALVRAEGEGLSVCVCVQGSAACATGWCAARAFSSLCVAADCAHAHTRAHARAANVCRCM